MFTATFTRDLAERVIATFCEALAALLLATGTGVLDTPWSTSLSLAGMTALVALLKGVAAAKVDPTTGASALLAPPSTGKRRAEVGRADLDMVGVIVVGVLLAWLLVQVLEVLFRA